MTKDQKARVDFEVNACEECPFLNVLSWPVHLTSGNDKQTVEPGYYCIHPDIRKGSTKRLVISLADAVGEHTLTEHLVEEVGGRFPKDCPLKVTEVRLGQDLPRSIDLGE